MKNMWMVLVLFAALALPLQGVFAGGGGDDDDDTPETRGTTPLKKPTAPNDSGSTSAAGSTVRSDGSGEGHNRYDPSTGSAPPSPDQSGQKVSNQQNNGNSSTSRAQSNAVHRQIRMSVTPRF